MRIAAAGLLLFMLPQTAPQPKWVRDRVLLEKACASGDLAACTRLAEILESGEQGPSNPREPDPKAALPLYEKSCGGGHPPACTGLAGLYVKGEVVDKNVGRAVELYSKACDGGSPFGCIALGGIFEKGGDDARMRSAYARAVQLLTESCDRGNGQHCSLLGYNYVNGRLNLVKDVARGLTLHERGCDLGDPSACTAAQYIYGGSTPGGPRDDARAKQLYERGVALQMKSCEGGDIRACSTMMTPQAEYQGCEHGDPAACFQLGQRYLAYRPDQPGDPVKVAHFFIKGCDQGEPGMCTEVGEMYSGVYSRTGRQMLPPDFPRAAALYSRACSAGDKDGCQRLAAMTAEGRGLPKDPAAAAKLYEAPCEEGDPRACLALGRLHRAGDGLPANPQQAALLLDRACKLKLTEGCYELGLAYRDGAGVTRDAVVAHRVLRDVCFQQPVYDSRLLLGCREACDLNDGAACVVLARAAKSGRGQPPLEPASATPLFSRARKLLDAECTSGSGQACHDLVMVDTDDEPPRRDIAASMRLLERGCTLGFPPACYRLASMYDSGTQLFAQDDARAVVLFIKACDMAHVESCERAGRMVTAGDGLPADARHGKELLERAEALKRKRGY
jgi:TPR repeat protein